MHPIQCAIVFYFYLLCLGLAAMNWYLASGFFLEDDERSKHSHEAHLFFFLTGTSLFLASTLAFNYQLSQAVCK